MRWPAAGALGGVLKALRGRREKRAEPRRAIMACMRDEERDGKGMWRISQAGEAAMRALRPPGHQWTGAENARVSKLIEAHLQAGRDGDLDAYRETMNALVEAACSSYRRHAEDPTSSPETPINVGV